MNAQITAVSRGSKWAVEKHGEYLEWVDAYAVQWGADPWLFGSESAAASAAKIVRARMSSSQH